VSSNVTDVPPEDYPTPDLPPVQDKADVRLNRARWLLVLAGLASGLLAFAVGEAIFDLIPAKKVEVPTMGQIVIAATVETSNVAAVRNGALTFGLLGICLGGCLGIAGGQARRSTSAAVIGGLVGSILGLCLAVGSSFALLPFFLKTLPNQPDYEVILSMIMHALIWGLTGAAAGVAFAVGFGEPRLIGRALAAGFAGAILGAIVFELIGAATFPLANTGQPISSTWQTRLLARLLVAGGTVACVILHLPRSRRGHATTATLIPPPAPS
jgi:hypothetical protein